MFNIHEVFIVDKFINTIPFCKSFRHLILVFPHPFYQIRRDSYIHRAIPLTRQYVNVEVLFQ